MTGRRGKTDRRLATPAAPADEARRGARRIDPLLALAGVVIVIVAALTAPPVRDMVIETARWLDEMLKNPAWVGYYTDDSDFDARGLPIQRQMFLAAGVPGRPVAVEGALWADHETWSADGERMILFSGPRIYLGDARGSVRPALELRDLDVRRADWIGTERQEIVVGALLLGCATPTLELPCSVVALVDLRTGNVQRWPIRTLFALGAARFSPDGQWLPLRVRGGGCGEVSALYHVASGRTLELVDGRGRRLSAFGWLYDGRLVSGACDVDAATLEVFVGPPDVPPMKPLAVLPWASRNQVALVDRQRDRILVVPRQADGMVSVLELDGGLTPLVRLPTLSSDDLLGQVQIHRLSRDGRYLSLTVSDSRLGRALGLEAQTIRTGMIEIVTGQLTWACEEPPAEALRSGHARGCSRLLVR